MRRTMDKSEYGIIWQKRNCLTDLDFADDIAIVAEEENACQEMTTKLEEQSAQVGLNISREKTKAMGITQRSSPQPIAIAPCGNIEYVERFTYLVSVIFSDGDVEADINTTLDWQKQHQSSDNLTTCGNPARLASKLNWTSTPPLSCLQPYTPTRLGRVQLEYVSSWTSFVSATYGRFWTLHGRTT